MNVRKAYLEMINERKFDESMSPIQWWDKRSNKEKLDLLAKYTDMNVKYLLDKKGEKFILSKARKSYLDGDTLRLMMKKEPDMK